MSRFEDLIEAESAARDYIKRLGVQNLYEVRRLKTRWYQLYDYLTHQGWTQQSVREAAVLFRLSEADVVDILTNLRRIE